MKTIKYIIVTIILVLVLSAALSSCAVPMTIQNDSGKVAGYTLKNKKELMQQKIANKKCKIVVATP